MAQPTTDRPALAFPELHAPAHWQAVDFISDLHLQASEPATHAAFLRYLQSTDRADALFILGDLFEVWVGDDALDSPAPGIPDDPERIFWRACAQALHRFSERTPVFFIAGNRDFLLGPTGLRVMGMQGLSDPCVLVLGPQRWLLSHGDALCLADTDYQAFRAEVRQSTWQSAFLARPLAEREATARALRAQSEARKRATGHDPGLWADLDADATRDWLQRAGAQTLIHGHTHRPADHDLGESLRRIVLSDWDAAARPPRGEVLRLSASGLQRRPVAIA